MMTHRRNTIDAIIEATMRSTDLNADLFPVHRVIVPDERHRPLDEERVQDLADSMARIGLLQPIVLDRYGRLIAGLHRLHAAMRLEWLDIPAVIIDTITNPLQAELIELDENLVRNELSVLERALHLHRRAQILDELGLRAPNHRPSKGVTVTPLDNGDHATPTTTEQLAASIGVSKPTAKRYLRIARGIAPDVAQAIIGTDLADSTTQLLDLARLEPYSQRIVLSILRDGRASTVQEAIRIMDAPDPEPQEGGMDLVLPSETGSSRGSNPVLGKCRRCGRPLRDPASAAAGIGPTCACADTGHDVTGATGAEEQEAAGPMDIHYSSRSPEWYTPTEILDAVLDVLGAIDLDPCADAGHNVPAQTHYTAQDDGLAQEWRGRVFMNPPYGRAIGDWVRKLLAEHRAGRVPEAIALVPARTDTAWFREFRNCLVCFVAGRLRFHGPDGQGHPAPFPSALVYMGPNGDRFAARFADIGDVWARVGD